MFDLVREKEETPSQCTASGSNSYGFCRLSLVRNSDGPPAIAIVPACDVADLGLDALRLNRPRKARKGTEATATHSPDGTVQRTRGLRSDEVDHISANDCSNS